jgi:putative holliday junction resolvase
MGIDYGSKRVGIAVSDEEKKYSFHRDNFINDKHLIKNILELIAKENIIKIILGYPLNLKSEKTMQTIEVEMFSKKLNDNLRSNAVKAEIIYEDERFTSKLAEYNLISSGLKKKDRKNKGLTDSISAQILLQDYLDKQKNKSV